MLFYLQFVKDHPILSAVIQFAILGTLGEIVSKWIIKRSFKYPFSFALTIWKMVVWSILAVCIKYAFKGFDGFVDHLSELGLLPQLEGVGRAFVKSAMINLQFGLFLVLFHRVLDNLVVTAKNWKGLDKGMMSLLWFWIPAHTLTFSLPPDYQIGVAALWSVVLGLILGLFNRR